VSLITGLKNGLFKLNDERLLQQLPDSISTVWQLTH